MARSVQRYYDDLSIVGMFITLLATFVAMASTAYHDELASSRSDELLVASQLTLGSLWASVLIGVCAVICSTRIAGRIEMLQEAHSWSDHTDPRTLPQEIHRILCMPFILVTASLDMFMVGVVGQFCFRAGGWATVGLVLLALNLAAIVVYVEHRSGKGWNGPQGPTRYEVTSYPIADEKATLFSLTEEWSSLERLGRQQVVDDRLRLLMRCQRVDAVSLTFNLGKKRRGASLYFRISAQMNETTQRR